MYGLSAGWGDPVSAPPSLSEGAMMNKTALLAALAAALCFSSSAFAAGVDSRAFTCPALQGLIAANRFIFINNPNFGDFVVANGSFCSGGDVVQLRSVPTIDNPQCPVNYCRSRSEADTGR